MSDGIWFKQHADKSLNRILPRLTERFAIQAEADPDHWNVFVTRLDANFTKLFELYYELYARNYDFFYHLEDLINTAARAWVDRSDQLKQLDALRDANPLWFQSNQMLGGVCYVDLFAGNLSGVKEKIPYFKELGLTYLHLMPLFDAPLGDNDGGYAVSSYRKVEPTLGTMEQLIDLTDELRREGISLVLDFVFNHTSEEYSWAKKAIAGDEEYIDYFRVFPDRVMPDAYEKNLREIFPEEHPGAFTYRPELAAWVWTTFHKYQWDLNYANPVVFNRMVEEMLFLANVGVEVLRLDAVAFIWKQIGTNCENLPEAHNLIKAFNSIARIAAPSLLFKSEAIVHPDEVIKYIGPDECQLSYNPLLMALLWNSLATREVRLLKQALQERFAIDDQCAWVNYVRCHDDIGWTFSDEDAARLNINGYDHRQFLNAFYTGRFPGSFARGLPFQENPKTGDARISGTCASLAGLEQALQEETAKEVDLAVKRILLLHGIILTIGGIPLIYLGDEIGKLNDYQYREDPDKAGDSRWVHRPYTDWDQMECRKDNRTIEGKIYDGIQRLVTLRKKYPVFGTGVMEVADIGNEHVLGYVRIKDAKRVLVLANFSEQEQIIPINTIRLFLLNYNYIDLDSDKIFNAENMTLGPCQICFLAAASNL